MAAIETLKAERLVALVLGEPERDALVRVLYVVKDNFWLDDVEESLLERLLERAIVTGEVFAETAATPLAA
jgi:hypothetical protein